MDIAKIVLEGTHVRLEPLSTAQHATGLAAAVSDGELWKNPVTFVPSPDQLEVFCEAAETAFRQQRELAFATIDKISGAIAGCTRFRCIERAHRRLEIGSTFLGRSRQRTHINTGAKYLMLEHAFERWGCNRVELLTDVLNTQSRTAIARIGAMQEGVLRGHMVRRDGSIRDSVIFSITAAEWPAVKTALANKLRAHDITPA